LPFGGSYPRKEDVEMALIELKCENCGRRVIIDDRELDYGEDEVFCPHCEEPIEVPQEE